MDIFNDENVFWIRSTEIYPLGAIECSLTVSKRFKTIIDLVFAWTRCRLQAPSCTKSQSNFFNLLQSAQIGSNSWLDHCSEHFNVLIYLPEWFHESADEPVLLELSRSSICGRSRSRIMGFGFLASYGSKLTPHTHGFPRNARKSKNYWSTVWYERANTFHWQLLVAWEYTPQCGRM